MKRPTFNHLKNISFPNSIAFAGAGMGFLTVPNLQQLGCDYFGINGIYVVNIILFATLLPLIHLFYPKTGLATSFLCLLLCTKIIDLPGGLINYPQGEDIAFISLRNPLILVSNPQRAFFNLQGKPKTTFKYRTVQ